ncbi:tRNA (adenosine(37)-N6)-threonylcarbamoyltransferase complex ATPase subunit type 1 TsaE [Conchiformibius kuhniae]|uniref:tRNA threonylcarbamoyladenosine biosynthesis protein TsaE n=1 Tax=Conchiformibius kuhniae TaxID=211502 RepID=A0ABD8B8I7_9NEIS
MAQPNIFLADEAAATAFARSWSPVLSAPCVVYLQGGLGAGKTTFARALLHGMGHAGAVKSPTYALVESYVLAGKTVHHFDLYRFASPDEWDDAGLGELFAPDCVCLIEWPQQGGALVPAADLVFEFFVCGQGRNCLVSARSEQGKRSLDLWQN